MEKEQIVETFFSIINIYISTHFVNEAELIKSSEAYSYKYNVSLFINIIYMLELA